MSTSPPTTDVYSGGESSVNCYADIHTHLSTAWVIDRLLATSYTDTHRHTCYKADKWKKRNNLIPSMPISRMYITYWGVILLTETSFWRNLATPCVEGWGAKEWFFLCSFAHSFLSCVYLLIVTHSLNHWHWIYSTPCHDPWRLFFL